MIWYKICNSSADTIWLKKSLNTDENSGDFANAGTQHGSQQIARAQYVTTDATQQTKVRTNIQSSMTIKSQWDGGIRREYVNSHEYIYIYIICIYI